MLQIKTPGNFEKYVHTEGLYEALDVCFKTGKNLLIYGPPGYGKSEFTHAFASQFAADAKEIFVQSLNDTTTAETLFGGIDLEAMDQNKIIYNTRNSFIDAEIVIFEEMLDAPPNTLSALKDTLTSGYFRNGIQQDKMKTKIVIGLTNKKPDEMNCLGDSHKALMERFPLKLELVWPDHKASRYEALVKAYLADKKKTLADILLRGLCQFFDKVAYDNVPISPRTVVYALDILFSMAKADGRENVLPVDVKVLKLLEGFAPLVADIEESLTRMTAELNSQKVMSEGTTTLAEIEGLAVSCTSPIQLLKYVKKLEVLRNALDKIQVTNDMARQLDSLKEKTILKHKQLQEQAINCVKADS